MLEVGKRDKSWAQTYRKSNHALSGNLTCTLRTCRPSCNTVRPGHDNILRRSNPRRCQNNSVLGGRPMPNGTGGDCHRSGAGSWQFLVPASTNPWRSPSRSRPRRRTNPSIRTPGYTSGRSLHRPGGGPCQTRSWRRHGHGCMFPRCQAPVCGRRAFCRSMGPCPGRKGLCLGCSLPCMLTICHPSSSTACRSHGNTGTPCNSGSPTSMMAGPWIYMTAVARRS
mmetsp:Transcript_113246/g.283604  ORF Transcript_113246/g.283604 Transcript_113246/m.283604 type:complete len:224 (+) Transcript_113246:1208-1879(+)